MGPSNYRDGFRLDAVQQVLLLAGAESTTMKEIDMCERNLAS